MLKKDIYRQIKSEYSDDEIRNILEKDITMYRIIVKSEMITREIFEQKGLRFFPCHERFKSQMINLLEYAKKNNIKLNLKDNVYITCDDIIKRIKENIKKRVDNIYRYYLEYCKNLNEEEKQNATISLEEMLDELFVSFNNLISEIDEDYIDDELLGKYYNSIKRYHLGIRKENDFHKI